MTENKQNVHVDSVEIQAAPEKQWVIVVVVLFTAMIIASLLYLFKPEAEKKVVKDVIPEAEYILASIQPISIPVLSQGSVIAKTRIKLIAEVNGRITQMAKLKVNGGFFEKGERLLSIDDTDYLLEITRAKAQVAAAQQQLIRVETEAGQAKYDLQQIGRDPSKSTSYALRKPHLAEARANLQAAEANLKISQLKLQRTRVVAPFKGRVVSKQVDIGQFVSAGTVLAEIYSTESVEVRLPISLQQTELLGIELRENQKLLDDIHIKLVSEYFSKVYQWAAKLSHIEGELDAKNRLVYIVAEVPDPYKKDNLFPDRPPLTLGMFVKAELKGLIKTSVIKLPRTALRYGDEVWLIDQRNQLQKVFVEVYAKDRSFIYTKSGVKQGDRVVINALDFPLQGMPVAPVSSNTLQNNNQQINKSSNE